MNDDDRTNKTPRLHTRAGMEERQPRMAKMDAIQTLKAEHQTIKRVLDALDRFVEIPEADWADIERFVEFIRLYADRMHHGKEEDILFERLVASGFPKQAGPLAVMYHEHDQGRALVNELTALGNRNGKRLPEDHKQLFTAARGYTELLRSHIHKEDNVLYPMAEAGLTAEAMALVNERVEQFETSYPQSGEKIRLEALADELTAKYGRQVT